MALGVGSECARSRYPFTVPIWSSREREKAIFAVLTTVYCWLIRPKD